MQTFDDDTKLYSATSMPETSSARATSFAPGDLSFTLINASTNAAIRDILFGGSAPVDIFLNDLDGATELTLRANMNPSTVSQVRFFVDGTLLETYSESSLALSRDMSRTFKPSRVMTTQVRIEAIPVQMGIKGVASEILFNIRPGTAPILRTTEAS